MLALAFLFFFLFPSPSSILAVFLATRWVSLIAWYIFSGASLSRVIFLYICVYNISVLDVDD